MAATWLHFFLIKILQQYCCYSETNVATKKATIVDKSTVNTIMDTFCIFLRKNVWRENSKSRSSIKIFWGRLIKSDVWPSSANQKQSFYYDFLKIFCTTIVAKPRYGRSTRFFTTYYATGPLQYMVYAMGIQDGQVLFNMYKIIKC